MDEAVELSSSKYLAGPLNCQDDWKALVDQHVEYNREWPTYDQVLDGIGIADYNETLTCPFDMRNTSNKTLCPHGAVVCCQLELFPLEHDNIKPYTGLLTPGTTAQHCILRLSSAMKPPSHEVTSTWVKTLLYAAGHKLRNAQLFPCAALKIFRHNVPSGNFLFGGSKVGQRETDYFTHCQCTSMTEQMPRLVQPFVSKFWRYSDYPLSLGLRDTCRYNLQGEEVEEADINFPFALIIRPRYTAQHKTNAEEDSFDSFLDEVLAIPAGTVLFDVFACPDPQSALDPTKLQRIGRITVTSEMIKSAPHDKLFFRHEKKENDYALRPDWPTHLKTSVAIDDGKTKGTIGKLAGWKLFEQNIERGGYVDFETT
jgi:hypothetical protein